MGHVLTAVALWAMCCIVGHVLHCGPCVALWAVCCIVGHVLTVDDRGDGGSETYPAARGSGKTTSRTGTTWSCDLR